MEEANHCGKIMRVNVRGLAASRKEINGPHDKVQTRESTFVMLRTCSPSKVNAWEVIITFKNSELCS